MELLSFYFSAKIFEDTFFQTWKLISSFIAQGTQKYAKKY